MLCLEGARILEFLGQMASKSQKLSQIFRSRGRRSFPYPTSLGLRPVDDSQNPVEPPDLPGWLKDCQDSGVTDPEEVDFVIPSLPRWVENHHFFPPSELNASESVHEEAASDVDKLSLILTRRFSSKEDVVELLNSCEVNPTHVLASQVVKRFSNDWIAAWDFFNWAKRQTGYVHSPELYNSMVDILGKFKEFHLMWELVNEMRGLDGYVTLITMSKVIRRLVRAGKYEDAIESFNGIDRFGMKQNVETLNTLLDALIKNGCVESARGVLLEFKDRIPLNLLSLNILIHGYCKKRMFGDARKFMDEMEKHGIHADVITYTCFIESYCDMKDFRSVYDLLDEMQEHDCPANVVTYTIIMHALGKARQVSEALEIYEKMKTNGCVPDTSFYSSLIYVLSRSGRLKDSWLIFEDMKNQGLTPDLLTYNTMISSACSRSQYERALNLLQKMEEDSCKPDVKTYAPLLKMCFKGKRTKLLKFVLTHMFNHDVSADHGTYTLLIHGLSNSGSLDCAFSFFENMISKGMVPMDQTYKHLVEKLQRKRMAEAMKKAEKLMARAKQCILVA